jgi:cytidylate kinase
MVIDGPAGAGTSTVAGAVTHALGFTYLDSGDVPLRRAR